LFAWGWVIAYENCVRNFIRAMIQKIGRELHVSDADVLAGNDPTSEVIHVFSPSFRSLIVAQRLHGIGGGGATRWDETGQGRSNDQEQRYACED
jgi:hypothetical protein